MLNCGKLIIVNFTLLSDIDNRKPLSESLAAYVIHFFFLAGVSVLFSSGNQPLHFTKNYSPSKLSGRLGRRDDP